jgi:hypothetical protein
MRTVFRAFDAYGDRGTTASTLNRGLRPAIAAVLLVSGIGWASPSFAVGALAVGVPDSIAQQGFASGYATNRSSSHSARRRALYECRHAPSTDIAHARCIVVRTFTDKCVAISMDPVAGTPGAGWAIGHTIADAQRDALANCEATAGPGRHGRCEISASHCDGGAR